MTNTDTERLDALEKLLKSDTIGNGLAIFPTRNLMGIWGVALQDLGDEDGSDLGEELTKTCATLREAIDAAMKSEEKEKL